MKILKAIIFWILSLTWGILTTAMGIVVALALLVTGHKPHRFHYLIYFEVGNNWGGLNLGSIFIVGRGAGLLTKRHEAGHGVQNIIFGVLMPFIVLIPSAVRYWYRIYLVKSGKKKVYELKPYDSIWFEGMATSYGDKFFS